jgi:hypothetical protein
MRVLSVTGAIVLSWLGLVVSCSASKQSNLTGTGSGPGNAGAGASGGDGSGGSMLSFANGTGGSTGSGNCQPYACSGDLHSVIDCMGVVVETCPPDKGCSNAKCVPACQAAIDNKSSIGCDYYAHNPITLFGRGCHALFV